MNKINILIVDDNPNNLLTLKTMLQSHVNANVIESNSGEDALLKIMKSEIGLIILDVQMPVMNGFETATLIKQRKKTSDIPIIFLTAEYKGDIFEKMGFKIGAVDYLTKPIQEEQFINKINLYLKLIEKNNELKLINEELKNAKEEAEKANTAKSQFIANVSHELRTPLTAILGYSQILNKSENLNEKQHYNIEVIYNSGQHLLNLINDILDLSKIEAGKMKLENKLFNLPELLKNVRETIQVQAEAKKIEFKLEATSNLPANVTGDEIKIHQILLNLLSNAIKFTDKGKVIFRVGLVKEKNNNMTDNKNLVRFEVIDSGIGIPDEDQEKIFNSFQQLNVKQSKTKGTGLGLTISRNLVKLMGSDLYVKSKIGKGSTFWFDLDFGILKNEYVQVNFENLNNNFEPNSPNLMEEKIATPAKEELKNLLSLAIIGDIINIRKQLEKLEKENPEFSQFITKLKLLVQNINLAEIESILKKYIKGE